MQCHTLNLADTTSTLLASSQALVHAWLSYQGCPLSVCRYAEAWVSCAAASASASAQLHPLVSHCMAADISALEPSEALEMAAWAGSSEQGSGSDGEGLVAGQEGQLLGHLQGSLMSGGIDHAWMQDTAPTWGSALRVLMGPGGGGATAAAVEAVLDGACQWVIKQGCVTTGTISLLRQVSGTAVPAIHSVLACEVMLAECTWPGMQ